MNCHASAVPKVFDLSQRELERARAGFEVERNDLQQQLTRSVTALTDARQLPEGLSRLREEDESVRARYAAASDRLEASRAFVLPALGVILLLAALASLVVGIFRQFARSAVY